ncbi:MAG: FAD-binding oxidoreductase [Burkholderia sp.]|uniref:NAD(P)/FAD-dependent oxidoreductase n=1 Tax=Burkholderia TaxID=32008 RepID=UPI001CF4E1E4|nr:MULTISPECIES: FAD-binding oxidoreductase [Burkholderia]MCA3777395.1 FAD-binding oxidoreductase [Burkholderia sp.]MCA3788562.1 FAD-binding oxidoreductase [Burkholderia sp.]MCA3798901.1 FAD-binding oxidoreductase [Burkholderia sp.]MCA3807403.1 FAD-binding oxidoreductase [Burkholderia sp.]MCA3816810.1 FAD-binding oxidoreductase [Burkholderia sp.]
MNRRQFFPVLAAPLAGAFPRIVRAAKSKDRVIVIGSGVMGASIAYHLATRGAEVTLIEKDAPASGTTRNSFAWINANNKTPYSYYALNYEGILGWRRLQLEIGPSLQIQWGGGIAWCGPDPQQIDKLHYTTALHQPWGYPIRNITRDDLERLVPGVHAGDFGAGWHSTIDGTLDPVAATLALVQAGIRAGVTLTKANVATIDFKGDRATGVTTDKGPFFADHVVIAAGNDSTRLGAQAGIPVPLRTSKGILAHSKPMPPLVHQVLMPAGLDIKQNPDGRIVAGSNFGDTGALAPTPELGAHLLERVTGVLPETRGIELDTMTLGFRVMPRDEYPIMGRGRQYRNVHVAAMHSGMTSAPAIGQLFAIEVLDGIETAQLQDFRPQRFYA